MTESSSKKDVWCVFLAVLIMVLFASLCYLSWWFGNDFRHSGDDYERCLSLGHDFLYREMKYEHNENAGYGDYFWCGTEGHRVKYIYAENNSLVQVMG